MQAFKFFFLQCEHFNGFMFLTRLALEVFFVFLNDPDDPINFFLIVFNIEFQFNFRSLHLIHLSVDNVIDHKRRYCCPIWFESFPVEFSLV